MHSAMPLSSPALPMFSAPKGISIKNLSQLSHWETRPFFSKFLSSYSFSAFHLFHHQIDKMNHSKSQCHSTAVINSDFFWFLGSVVSPDPSGVLSTLFWKLINLSEGYPNSKSLLSWMSNLSLMAPKLEFWNDKNRFRIPQNKVHTIPGRPQPETHRHV